MDASEEPGSFASSSGATEDGSTLDPLGDYFIRHKLTKMDTLAGLAVRYNVTVSDIKRANGLLADTAMYAKDTLLIPTRPLPVGPEYSTWAGMIVTHYGRLGYGDDAGASSSPYAFSQPYHLQQLRGYYSTGPSRSQSPKGASEDGDRLHLLSNRGDGWATAAQQQQHQHQQVELMERSSSMSAVATYVDDRLRRRGRGESYADEQQAAPSASAGSGAGGAGSSGAFVPPRRTPLFASSSTAPPPHATTGAASAGSRQLQQLRDALLGNKLLQRLKKVASQPALAVPAGAGLSVRQVGHAAVASFAASGPGQLPTASMSAVAAPNTTSRKDD